MHTPVSIYLKVRDMYPQSALMESSDYHAGENSLSFIALCPLASIGVNGGIVTANYPDNSRTEEPLTKTFNVEKAREVIKTRPQKLSLQEMYLVAQTYPKGSAEFNNVFDIAVRMFPEDKLANLNAASAAIERGDKVSAEKYLLKAGDSAEANNARGCLAAMKEDYQTAKQYFEKAVAGGLKEAQENLDKVNQAL